MVLEGVTGQVLRVCEGICRLCYLNLLWILFTALGLGVFGFMPATVALFTITRKWVMGEMDAPIFKLFWRTYYKEFIPSTLMGICLFAIGYIIYIDLALLPTGGYFTIVRWALIVLSVFYVISLLYIFPVYVHYQMKKVNYLKYAILLGASNPHYTLLMAAGIILLYYIVLFIPGIIPFFSVSGLSYILIWIAYRVFKKIDLKVTKNEQ